MTCPTVSSQAKAAQKMIVCRRDYRQSYYDWRCSSCDEDHPSYWKACVGSLCFQVYWDRRRPPYACQKRCGQRPLVRPKQSRERQDARNSFQPASPRILHQASRSQRTRRDDDPVCLRMKVTVALRAGMQKEWCSLDPGNPSRGCSAEDFRKASLTAS